MSTFSPFSSGGSGSVKLKERTSSLPVFVYPEELQFVESDRSSHKQVLTIYNPYSFSIHFEVFCTAPDRYAVVESSGNIKANCCVDIVVRHRTASSGSGPYIKDKFRIDICVDKKVIGRRFIGSTLIKGDSERERQIEETGPAANGSVSKELREVSAAARHPGDSHGPSVLMLLVAIFSMLALLLPLEGDSNSLGLPHWLYLSVNQKLFAAFALGLVTMAIMRP